MKKLFSTVLAVIGFSFLMAQSADVPTGIKIAFKNAYKSTTVEWSASTQYYIAKWDANNKHVTAYYAKENEATLLRTETEVPVTELSEGSQKVITNFTTNGSNYTVVRAFKVENMAETADGCEFAVPNGNNIRVFFDASGTMNKREIAQ